MRGTPTTCRASPLWSARTLSKGAVPWAKTMRRLRTRSSLRRSRIEAMTVRPSSIVWVGSSLSWRMNST